jgi:hypothetical protein
MQLSNTGGEKLNTDGASAVYTIQQGVLTDSFLGTLTNLKSIDLIKKIGNNISITK